MLQNMASIVWRIIDGKPGHEAQTSGLVQALGDRVELRVFDLSAQTFCASFFGFTFGRFAPGTSLPKPDFIIGAGHRTHLTVLAAKRAFGGQSIVLMKPSLPLSLFDLCIIPEHDRPRLGANVLVTRGVLNPVREAKTASADRGLFLIGGPSKHHGWDTERILNQVDGVLAADEEVSWTLTTSRRTPTECVKGLGALEYPNLNVVPFEETPKGWVAEHLETCGKVWVSEDSVSMVFEALTAGASVGLLRVPRLKQRSRVYTAIDFLVENQQVLWFDESVELPDANHSKRLAEADRCADFMVKEYLNAHS